MCSATMSAMSRSSWSTSTPPFNSNASYNVLFRVVQDRHDVAVRLRERSQRFWLVVGLGLFLGSLAILIAFDVIRVGDDVLDDLVPRFVFGILFLTFWSGILILLALAILLGRRLLRRQ